jgi:hypothetical protein
MGNRRSVRLSVLVTVTAVVALTGCSSVGGAEPAPNASATRTTVVTDAPDADPAAGTVDPMQADTSAAAVCGQISALDTISLNATIGQRAGELTDEQVEALSASVRFGYEHLTSDDPEMSNALAATHEYLEEHPAPATGPALDQDSADWDLAVRTLITACRAAGSNVVATATSGG